MKISTTDEFLDKTNLLDGNYLFNVSINSLDFYKTKFLFNCKLESYKKKLDFSDIIKTDNSINIDKTDKINDIFEENINTKSLRSNFTLKELEDIIVEKRDFTKKCFLQAEKVSRAAENLRIKAINSVNELKKYEESYDNFE